MLTQLRKKTEGFTIIEVMIVLAIAGLILLIVFLAIPALQRNSRNTQRKDDVATALGAFQEYLNNNGGQLPATVAAGLAGHKPGFYTAAQFTGSTTNASAVASVTANDTGVIINNFSKCPTTVPATGAITTNVGATARNITAIYKVETSGAAQNQCLDM